MDTASTQELKAPKLFISYSQTSREHSEWVIKLAEDLRQLGVDVILDVWDLKKGHNAHVFMESMVNDIEIQKVLMICDDRYVERANGRAGGVGTETIIISDEVYSKVKQEKFVAVVLEDNEAGNALVPIYYKGNIYIDMRDASQYEDKLEEIVRWCYDRPLHVKPALGRAPTFIMQDETNSTINTSAKARLVLNAIANSRSNANALLQDYLDDVVNAFDLLKLPHLQNVQPQEVVDSIHAFIPQRDEILSVIRHAVNHLRNEEMLQVIHRFFEGLHKYTTRPITNGTYSGIYRDNTKYFVHELFLYACSYMLKYNFFDGMKYLLNTPYFVFNESQGGNMVCNFDIYYHHLESLKFYNTVNNLNRLSLHADYLIKNCTPELQLSSDDLVQSEFLICLVASNRGKFWYPISLIYASRRYGAFEIFARSVQQQYWTRVSDLLGMSKDQLKDTLEKQQNRGLNKIASGEWLDLYQLTGYNDIATRP